MSFRVICGPAGAGKTRAATALFQGAIEAGLEPLYITPSGPDQRHFTRQLIEQLGVVTGGAVLTFDGLCRRLLKGAGDSRRIIEPHERPLLVRSAVTLLGGKLDQLREPMQKEGFVDAAARLFSELAALGVDQAELGERLAGWSGGRRRRRELTGDLFRLYSEYGVLLKDMDAMDIETARLAAAAIAAGGGHLSGNMLVFDGFKDFTPEQHLFLRQARQSGVDVTITLPCTPDGDVYAGQRRHLEQLGIAPEDIEWLPPADPGGGALTHLTANLFEEGAARVPCDEGVILVSGVGVRGQAEQVAAEILELFRAGTSLDDIAVVCRSSGRDLALIAETLAEFGVPSDLPAPLPASRTPLGRALLAILDFAATGRAATLMGYLRSGFAPYDDAMVDRFDCEARRYGTEGFEGLLSRWRSSSGNGLEAVTRLREAAARGLESLCEELGELIPRMLSVRLDGAAALPDLDVAAAGKLVELCRDVALHVLEAAEDDGGDGRGMTGGGADALDLLRRSIAAAEVRAPGGLRRGCVRLLDPHRVLNQNFDTVFVCGLLEKQFPRAVVEDPFFSDAERQELSAHGLPLEGHESALEEEKFLFHRTLTRARSRIYLCYPYCDKEGKPTVPSLFIDYVRELFSDNPRHVQRLITEVAFAPTAAPTPTQALRSLAVAGAAGGLSASLEAAAAAGLDERLRAADAAARPRPPAIADPALIERLAGMDTFSVTALEKYAKCPFWYFIDHILDPAVHEQPDIGLYRGSIAHAVLCRFHEQMRKAGVVLSRPRDQAQVDEARRQLADIIRETFAARERDLRNTMLEVQLGSYLDRYIDRELACRRRRFEPQDFEVSFGMEERSADGGPSRGGHNSVPGMLQLGDVKIRGRLDRIDIETDEKGEMMRGRAVVIDYKTSSSATSHKDFTKKYVLQLPIYIKALRDVFGLEPVGGEHYALLGDERRGLFLAGHQASLDAGACGNGDDFVSREEFDRVIDTAVAAALDAVRGIRSAAFACSPVESRICDWCGCLDVCRREWLAGGGEVDDD